MDFIVGNYCKIDAAYFDWTLKKQGGTVIHELSFTSLSTNVLLASLNDMDHSPYSSGISSRQAKHKVRNPIWAYCSTASTKALVCCPRKSWNSPVPVELEN